VPNRTSRNTGMFSRATLDRCGRAAMVAALGLLLTVACRTKPSPTTSRPVTAPSASLRMEAGADAPATSAVAFQTVPRVVEIQAAGDHTWALRSDGALFGWGTNTFGALGPNKADKVWLKPRKMDGIPAVTHVATGRWHTCAIVDSGNVHCWGRNFGGTLGNGSGKDAAFSGPSQVVKLADAVEISAASGLGGGTSCVRLSNGQAHCWGILLYSPLGIPFHFPDLGQAKQLSARNNSVCAVQLDQGLRCSGWIVGMPFQEMWHYPTGELPHLPKVTKVAVADCHICVISTSGQVHCWGEVDYYRAVGSRDSAEQIVQLLPSPRPVAGLDNVVDIAMGEQDDICALRRDGTLWCWKRHERDLGGLDAPSSKPELVPGLSDVKQVTLGSSHWCVLTKAGEVFCWGDNHRGQLGGGDMPLSKIPLPVVCQSPLEPN
jgi:alpha-tubulin suppressor-like RCC1 family protein